MEWASGVELASCVELASGVELASCQFPPYFRAGRIPTLLLFSAKIQQGKKNGCFGNICGCSKIFLLG
ncbi:hypothetical protein [Moorena producens]|uniref:hypothetical protein n=1 Tax=Moorena producens TaxID=1155739 RepID=UPI003C75A407